MWRTVMIQNPSGRPDDDVSAGVEGGDVATRLIQVFGAGRTGVAVQPVGGGIEGDDVEAIPRLQALQRQHQGLLGLLDGRAGH